MTEQHIIKPALLTDQECNRGPKLYFAVSELGFHAAAALSHRTDWSVLAVFQRAFYCASKNNTVFCIGGYGAGLTPLSILCKASHAVDWKKEELRSGTYVKFNGCSLEVDERFIFQFSRSQVWNPPFLCSDIDSQVVERGLSALAAEVRHRAPRDGFGHLIQLLCRGTAAPFTHIFSTPLSRAASTALVNLKIWLRENCFTARDKVPPPPSVLEALIGLGPGLTPSGDDFLGGVMIALRMLGADRAARALSSYVLPLAQQRTSLVSYAYLRCAADGAGAEPLHRTILGITKSGAETVRLSLDDLSQFGKTSGWDALAGAVLVLSCFGNKLERPLGSASTQPFYSSRANP